MKETFFYQVRQDNTLSLTELALLIRQAFISLYPGTSFDESMTTLYGSENCFFLSRTGRLESLAVFVSPEPLDAETLAVFLRKAVEAEAHIRGARSQVQDFLIALVTAELPEQIKATLKESPAAGWSLFEYWLLQSEMEEGLALKPFQRQRICPPALQITPVRAAPKGKPVLLPDRRLSPEELSALIDLSLGLEMRSRGMDWDTTPPQEPPKTETSRFRMRDDGSGLRSDIDA